MMKFESKQISECFLVTDFVANGSFASLKENVNYLREPDYAVLVRTTDNTNNWGRNYVYVSKNSYDFLKKSSLLPNDLIISNVGEPGKAFLCPDLGMPMTLGPNSILVRPLRNDFDIRYFYYYTVSKLGQQQIESICSATTQKKFNKTSYRSLQFPVPHIDFQKKIADILDKTDELRQNDKKILDKYDQLAQSVFLEMFGDTKLNPQNWEIKFIEEICSEIVDCPHSTPKYVDEVTEYPCVRTTELRNGSIDWSSMKYLNREGYFERTSRLKPKHGDILYGREGSFGEAAIIPPNTKMSLGQRVMLFRPKYEIINSVYFLSLIRSRGLYEQAVSKTSGSTVGHVNIKDIRKFNCPLPPLNIQNRFAKLIESIEYQKQLSNQSHKKSEELFQSLLQSAFKGELV